MKVRHILPYHARESRRWKIKGQFCACVSPVADVRGPKRGRLPRKSRVEDFEERGDRARMAKLNEISQRGAEDVS